MKSHSIVFIDSSSTKDYNIKKNKYSNSSIGYIVDYFTLSPYDLPKRIFLAFIPPVFNGYSKRVYIDFVGPCLAILTLAAILHFGHAYKLQSVALSMSPTEIIIYYCTFITVLTYFLAKVGRATLGFTEIAALIGYGLYGHVLTLAMSQLFDHDQSNVMFFLNLILFGGLSGLRIALVLLASIPIPAYRLIVCSFSATCHLMFTIFVHFAYMHSTFAYGSGTHVRQQL